MKKFSYMISVVLIVATMIVLVGFTKYREDKVYSEKGLTSYSSENEVNKGSSITRGEALEKAKGVLKKGFSINIDNMDLNETVTLNKKENGKLSFDIMWESEEKKVNYKVFIDVSTGKVEKISVNQGTLNQDKEKYKLTKDEVNEIINNVLNLVDRDAKDYNIDYDVKGASVMVDTETGKVKNILKHSGDIEKGYNRYAGIRVGDKMFFIDCKDKKVVSGSF